MKSKIIFLILISTIVYSSNALTANCYDDMSREDLIVFITRFKTSMIEARDEIEEKNSKATDQLSENSAFNEFLGLVRDGEPEREVISNRSYDRKLLIDGAILRLEKYKTCPRKWN